MSSFRQRCTLLNGAASVRPPAPTTGGQLKLKKAKEELEIKRKRAHTRRTRECVAANQHRYCCRSHLLLPNEKWFDDIARKPIVHVCIPPITPSEMSSKISWRVSCSHLASFFSPSRRFSVAFHAFCSRRFGCKCKRGNVSHTHQGSLSPAPLADARYIRRNCTY